MKSTRGYYSYQFNVILAESWELLSPISGEKRKSIQYDLTNKIW